LEELLHAADERLLRHKQACRPDDLNAAVLRAA